MYDAASPATPRRKRSAKSMAISDDEDAAGEGLKRVSIACVTCRRRKIRCDGRQPACTTCTKNRKTGCTYVRVTPEENSEVKARKRLAREQKAQYKALGIEPPPKLHVGRRRWEHTIRFEQQKLRGVTVQPPTTASEAGPYSPESYSTSTWRLGDVIRPTVPQSAPVATQERRGYFERPELARASATYPGTTVEAVAAPAPVPSYAFPPVKPMPAYSPYPLTPPMDEYQPEPRLDGTNALGLFSPPAAYHNGSPWLSPAAGTAPAPVFATSRVPSLRLQRSANFQPVPKPLTYVPAQPEPLALVASPRDVVPYPSPQASAQFLPIALPSPGSLAPPAPAPLYAADSTRPPATCDFIPRVGATPPRSERELSLPPSREQENLGVIATATPFLPVPESGTEMMDTAPMPISILAQAAYPQKDLQLATVASTAMSCETPAPPTAVAPSMFPSTSWNDGSPFMSTARPAAAYASDCWLGGSGDGGGIDTHAHSTPELYSSAGW
ncbi:hypothetical protein JCM3774_004571 [Rhodotorula dairenensis]